MKSSPPPTGGRFGEMQYGGILLRRTLSLLTGGGMLLPDQFILAAMQQPSRTANLSKARQRLIEVHTRIWQVELHGKNGELVDRSAADQQFFSLIRNVGDDYKNLPARTSGLVAGRA